MHCVVIGNRTENAKSMIIGPNLSFNFRSLKIYFFKHCGAHLICSRECFANRFGTYALGIKEKSNL